jgi:hypothetical protein
VHGEVTGIPHFRQFFRRWQPHAGFDFAALETFPDCTRNLAVSGLMPLNLDIIKAFGHMANIISPIKFNGNNFCKSLQKKINSASLSVELNSYSAKREKSIAAAEVTVSGFFRPAASAGGLFPLDSPETWNTV